MTTRIYSTLDSGVAGPGLIVDSGRSIIATASNGLDNHRKAMGTLTRGNGVASFECYFWSDSRTAFSGAGVVGVAAAHSPLDKFVGEDDLSFGFVPGTGALLSNNATIGTGPAIDERICIGVHVDLVNLVVRWYAAGNFIGKAALPPGLAWAPAVTVSGAAAGDRRAYLNFNGPFDYPRAEAG